jgi:hypothetical protein
MPPIADRIGINVELYKELLRTSQWARDRHMELQKDGLYIGGIDLVIISNVRMNPVSGETAAKRGTTPGYNWRDVHGPTRNVGEPSPEYGPTAQDVMDGYNRTIDNALRQSRSGTIDKSQGQTATGPATFRGPDPCAELKDSKALSSAPGGPGVYPEGEIDFWNKMLSDPSVPNYIKDKIRAWNGSRNRAAILNTRDGRSLQELAKLLGWDTMPEFMDQLRENIFNLFDSFEETARVAFDEWLIAEMIDMAVNELLTGVPFAGSTDPIKWLEELAKKMNNRGELAKWFLSTLKDNIQQMMFRDLFANMYLSILAFAKEARGKRYKYGDKYGINPKTKKPFTEEEYLEALMHDTWNAEGNLDQSKDALNDLEDTTYYDMVGAWMDWFRKNNKKYNEEDPHGKLLPYREGCKEQDDAARKRIRDRLSIAKSNLMGWNQNDSTGGGVGRAFGGGLGIGRATS